MLYHGSMPVTFGRSFANPIVLNSSAVSRQHGRLEVDDNQLWLTDLDSANGIWSDGQRIQRVALSAGSSFRVGQFVLTATLTEDKPTGKASGDHSAESALTISLDRETFMEAIMQDSAETAVLSGDDLAALQLAITTFKEQPETKVEVEPKQRPLPAFPPPFFSQKQVRLADVKASDIAVDETTYLALGGGLGSLAWVDYLRICGVPARQIVAIGVESEPHGRYRRLCQLSQIPDRERLRSDSGSTADNIWGWPGYAVREVWHLLRRRHLKQAVHIAYQIFGEPTLRESYTPRACDVYASIEREAARIGWDKIWRYGRLRAIRQTDDGRYIVATSQTSRDKGRQHRFIIAPYLHLAVGYPGVRFLPDLQAYRLQSSDFKRVVNAYEDHEHIYQQVQAGGGTVLLRGRGIVASRILQRLCEARQHNPNITVLHLMR
jgi:pSer/pThr/pTyr-binding forkhead associated (FHA) protein